MPTNNHVFYEGAVARTFYRNGKFRTEYSTPIYFVAEQGSDSVTLREALLKRYHQLEAFYTPKRFTNPVFRTGQEDEIIPLQIIPVLDPTKIATLEKRL